ncbi:hypothetical protein RR46_15084 [Papilio xuthus]|uniref:Uncharacterized protein n=1 Tax=Papilio xuthus TaxID=66420 RepID=A0A194PKG1_PAPXU|nr:hypothetical protein RR46_15084 [Papilio xuthus]
MDSNSVSPMPELAPIAEFDKSPPSPPNEEVPMDDLPPPPTISQAEGKKIKILYPVGDLHELNCHARRTPHRTTWARPASACGPRVHRSRAPPIDRPIHVYT